MSKIGKMPVKIEEGVEISIGKEEITIKGPKGELKVSLPQGVFVAKDNNFLSLTVKDTENNALFGTCRALIANAVKGVTQGFEKKLELVGAGFRGEVADGTLILSIGFSHPVKVVSPEGITFKIEKTTVIIEGIDKGLVGQIAAKIRKIRPPEPYKGKGISYSGEVIRRKAGKAAKGPAA